MKKIILLSIMFTFYLIGSVDAKDEVLSLQLPIPPKAVAPSEDPIDQGEDLANIKDFEADPTGTTDSTVAIQLALDSLSAGGKLVIPTGTYLVSNPLLIKKNNITIQGYGWGSKLITTVSNKYAILAVVYPAAGITIRDLELIGVADNEEYYRAGIHVNTNVTGTNHSDIEYDAHVLVDHVHFTGSDGKGLTTGIRCNQANYLTVTNSLFDNLYGINSGYGYGITSSSSYARYLNNRFISSIAEQGRHAIYVNGQSKYVQLSGNYAKGFLHTPFPVNISFDETSPENGMGIQMIGNTAIDSNLDPYTSSGVFALYIENGTIAGGGQAIIANNISEGCRGHQIYAHGYSNSIISGNIVMADGNQDSEYHSIKIEESNNTIIRGNIIKDITSANMVGIEIQQSSNVSVSGNTISGGDNFRAGIRFNASPDGMTNNSFAINNIVLGNPWNGNIEWAADNEADSVNFARSPKSVLTGAVDPQDNIPADIGTIYLRTDSEPGSVLYIKESNDGSTDGWMVIPGQ